MKKLCISTIIASSLVFLGCAAPLAEQKGSELAPFPQAEQLKVKTARPLMLRTETQNKNCDVTTFFQIMSERNPDIQNILDVRFSEVEKNDKTECSYWGIGVTYEGVETSVSPKTSFTDPIKDTVSTQPEVAPKAEAPVEEKVAAPAENPEVAPVEATAAETVPAADSSNVQVQAPTDSVAAPIPAQAVADTVKQ